MRRGTPARMPPTPTIEPSCCVNWRDRSDRGASFVSAVVVVWPDGRHLAVEGVCRGTIAERELGERGFGYDPLFIPDDGDGRSFSQMSDAEKNRISHRARALQALIEALDGDGGSRS